VSRLVEPRRQMPTLAQLWSGKYCPHETECVCRTSDLCPEAKNAQLNSDRNYPMMYLAGCSFAYNGCCCRVLEEINNLANKYIELAGISEPPIPLEIISLFDPNRFIEIRPLPLKRLLGCTWLVDKEWVIHLNSNTSPEVTNFTAFHEGFHIICGNSGFAFKQAGERYRKVSERLADYFAASILMPKNFVYGLWPEVKDLAKMAGIFGVPQLEMKDWLTRLRILEI
jgi:IrrE N-terminal-like domain